MKIKLLPRPSTIAPDNGIGRVLYAQRQHLPAHGIEFVEDDSAELFIGHTQQFDMPRIDVLHLHGMYWLGDLNSGLYGQYNLLANDAIISAARRAYCLTVPSEWVAMPFKRDMRIAPQVIGHGIDFDEWQIGKPQGYVLWGKNRAIDVCMPDAPYELAKRGVSVMSTYAPQGVQIPRTMQLIGPQDQDAMKQIISGADVYLSTVKETFGIQTIEAMACGVPVIGWDYGGTAEIVTNGYDGILVRPGDYDALYNAYKEAMDLREVLGENARRTAARYDWRDVMKQYAELYQRVAEDLKHERKGVSVVITNYNYGRYVDKAVDSVLNQSRPADEIIVVDDGSTDDSLDQLRRFNGQIKVITQENQGVAAARTVGIEAATQENVVLLDADDQIAPGFIAALYPAMRDDRGLGIAYTGLLAVGEDGRVIPTDFPPEFDWEKQATASNPPSCCVPSCCMFKREMWRRAGPHKQEYAPGEDAEFWTRGLSVGFTARKVTAEKLFIYRVHGGSATRRIPYKPIDDRLPWLRDKRYPLAAPSEFAPLVKSYSEPKVSIIVNVEHDTCHKLPDLIDSILGQTMREWEIFTAEEFESTIKHKARYPFIKCFTDSSIALLTAHADLVLCLDADDMLTNSALEDMLVAFVDSGGRYIYPDTLTIKGERTVEPDYNQANPIHQPVALVPTAWAREVEKWETWREFYAMLAIKGHCGQRLGRALVIREAKPETLNARGIKRLKKYEGAEMGTCCGGTGDVLMAAKNALAGMMNSPVEAGRVRLEYIGENVGAISFFGQNGAEYRGGNNDFEKFVDVAEVDVARLLSTGRWKLALAVAPTTQFEEPQAMPEIEVKAIEPDPVAVTVPDVIEVTAEDEAINQIVNEQRKRGRPRK